MSTVYQVGPFWKGFAAIQHLIIFGDSYSDVGFDHVDDHPTAAQPLGVAFPGNTYNEEGLPNWVGCLISKHCPPPRFNPSVDDDEQDEDYLESPLLVYDYAKGGDTVAGVRIQIEHSFIPTLTKTGAAWDPVDTLFKPKDTITELFELQEKLYHCGARNFLFIDVPPIHRSPAISEGEESEMSTIYLKWNASLRIAIQTFCKAHPKISAFLFSSFQLFDSILDTPEAYGFKSEDARQSGGTIWLDWLHPTGKVHDHIANGVAAFLTDISPQ
ncbi:hypothetical protein B0H34DRAFT_852737 [Crassisporium funariophilum]|nr:hypothetical protein B0H34DRAFT_852737 [Crassisporium funariophilum]